MSTKPTDTQIADSLRALTDVLDDKIVVLTGGATIYRVAARNSDTDLDAATSAAVLGTAFRFFKFMLEQILTGESNYAADAEADAESADADDDPLSGLCEKHRREAEEARAREASFDDEASDESDIDDVLVELIAQALKK